MAPLEEAGFTAQFTWIQAANTWQQCVWIKALQDVQFKWILEAKWKQLIFPNVSVASIVF